MSKRENKRQDILMAGLQVMKERGYNGTSVKDIVEAAGVPKGSFYNYFDSKEAFVLAAIDYTSECSFDAAIVILSDRRISAARRLAAFFEQGASYATDCDYKSGCFLGNMCQEMSDTSEAVRARLCQVLKRQISQLADVIEEGKGDGSVAAQLDAGLVAEFLFNAWEGALMGTKAARSRQPLDAFLEMLPSVLGSGASSHHAA